MGGAPSSIPYPYGRHLYRIQLAPAGRRPRRAEQVLVLLVLTAAASGSVWLPGGSTGPAALGPGGDWLGPRRVDGPAAPPLPEVAPGNPSAAAPGNPSAAAHGLSLASGWLEPPAPAPARPWSPTAAGLVAGVPRPGLAGAGAPGPAALPAAGATTTAAGDPARLDAPAMASLPVWVQAHRATRLWSGPDAAAVGLTELPQWTYLRTLGVAHLDRLFVEYAGDFATRPAGVGWVDAAAVGPSGDPGRWLANHRATSLWSGPDAAAVAFTTLPQWTRLRMVETDPPSGTRLRVEFFGDLSGRQPGVAWVDQADVGPVSPPQPLPRYFETRTFTSKADFIETIGAAARTAQRSTGVPASVTVAQAILESDWGRSRLSREAHNLFGIKALGGPGTAGTVTLATWEHLGSLDLVVQSAFRAYHNLEESVADHAAFFLQNGRYAAALAAVADPQAFARAINQAGYATDPSYAAKLIGLMDRYDLYRFDR